MSHTFTDRSEKTCNKHEGHLHQQGGNYGPHAFKEGDPIDYEPNGHPHRIHESHGDPYKVANYRSPNKADAEPLG